MRLAPGDRVFGKWPKRGVGFEVIRGSFVIPLELFEEGREEDLARYFASRMPENAKPGRREKVYEPRFVGGRVEKRHVGVRLHWRIIRVVAE